jgi:hypothetical protein
MGNTLYASEQTENVVRQKPRYIQRKAFYLKYHITYFTLTRAIDRGKIRLHLIDGQVVIDEDEALGVLKDYVRVSSLENEKTDLFS